MCGLTIFKWRGQKALQGEKIQYKSLNSSLSNSSKKNG